MIFKGEFGRGWGKHCSIRSMQGSTTVRAPAKEHFEATIGAG